MPRLILASASPRRRELLTGLGVRDLVIRPAKGEERVPENASPEEIVLSLARQKAMEIAPTAEADDVVIAADTVVFLDGLALGKPHSEAHAREMLRRLSGRMHRVLTGVCVVRGEAVLCEAEEAKVFFRELTDREIDAYIATNEPMDKAGAYGIQGKASLFVEHIEGDFFNIMGLPLCRLGNMLKKVGVELL